jgi:hypothetical protein
MKYEEEKKDGKMGRKREETPVLIRHILILLTHSWPTRFGGEKGAVAMSAQRFSLSMIAVISD